MFFFDRLQRECVQIPQAGTNTPAPSTAYLSFSVFLYALLSSSGAPFRYLCLQSHFVVLLVAGFVDGADAGADIP